MTLGKTPALRGPNFLGIGAPGSGTTWLHKMLERHPKVWVPPIKEVHYFDSIDPALCGRLHLDRLGDRLRKHGLSRLAHYLAAMARPVAPALTRRARPDWNWDRRYFSSGGSIDWYCRLFDGRVKEFQRIGEITPAYIALSDDVIHRIKTQTQVEKFIVLLRNPVDSIWTGQGKRMRKVQIGHSRTEQTALVRTLLRAGLTRRLYASNLQRWMSHFGREQFFVGYYEDLSENPAGLIDRICDFLQVEPLSPMLGDQMGQRVNSRQSSTSAIDPAVERMLAEQFEPDLRQLADLLGGQSENWHQRALSVLNRQE